jgi:hypothetical protein
MGNNGKTRMNLWAPRVTRLPRISKLFGEKAYAEFDKFEYIRIYGQEAYTRSSASWRISHLGHLGALS